MNLEKTDPEIARLIKKEANRQQNVLEMIPSENLASGAIREALGSVFTNKYSEGYPGKRYYQGNEVVDEIEHLAQERAKELFGVRYVNVQALSGTPANNAIYMALLHDKTDKIMGLELRSGGHLSHGAPHTFASRFFTTVNYTLGSDCRLDYDAIEELAMKEKPQIIVCGYTAYPRIIDFKRFAEIADSVDAYLLADISHIAGLVVAGEHPSPAPYADVIMTTTHKTLRGPRGALIMVTKKGLAKNPDLPKRIDSAVMPGLQGGPHDNQTAAIAVALHEAKTPAFKEYARQTVKNTHVLATELTKHGFTLDSGGSDNHLILIDLRDKGINGAVAAIALEVAGIVLNKNTVPFDTNSSSYPSGIRLGTPTLTTRGMGENEMRTIALWIKQVMDVIPSSDLPEGKIERREFLIAFQKEISSHPTLRSIAKDVRALCEQFPVP
jgi:glycine hydroxymethyltransferase